MHTGFIKVLGAVLKLGPPKILYSGKLSRISRFCGYLRKFSPAKFGGVASLAAPASNLQKFSQQKSYFPPIRKSFLPRKIPTIQYKKEGLANRLEWKCAVCNASVFPIRVLIAFLCVFKNANHVNLSL